MSKFRGKIGFVKDVETTPGVWEPVVTEKMARGDIIRLDRRWDKPNEVEDHLTISEEISIVVSSYIKDNLSYIKYVEHLGVKWRVTSITPAYPRIRLSLGGEYNE
jgi:hypothetical protein